VRALDAVLIVQADHEQNASTSTMRLVGSTRANPYACTAAAIAALWGPLHGGANEAVLQTLAEIGSVERIPEILRRAKDKNDPFRLAGFGHRIYKSYNPRAKVLRACCYELLDTLGQRDDPLLKIAMELERIALDEYFAERKLYPNVDFYSGIIFRALGLPPAMFTPIFAVARTVGWVTHWNERIADPETPDLSSSAALCRSRRTPFGPDGRAPGARAAGRLTCATKGERLTRPGRPATRRPLFRFTRIGRVRRLSGYGRHRRFSRESHRKAAAGVRRRADPAGIRFDVSQTDDFLINDASYLSLQRTVASEGGSSCQTHRCWGGSA
jgi:hypothetical protein